MGKSYYYKLLYHTIWRTHNSLPLITPKIEKVLYPYFQTYIKKIKCDYYIANGMQDHVHIILTIPPRFSISDIIGKIKGSSSHYINKDLKIEDNFYWQDGYGVLSYKEADLQMIINYVKNQKRHHQSGTTDDEMERTDVDE
jgi:putative transposase